MKNNFRTKITLNVTVKFSATVALLPNKIWTRNLHLPLSNLNLQAHLSSATNS